MRKPWFILIVCGSYVFESASLDEVCDKAIEYFVDWGFNSVSILFAVKEI